MAKVTGIGGIFFLANDDNKALAEWYRRCLGLELNEFGGLTIWLAWSNDYKKKASKYSRDPRRTRMENSPGYWTRKATRLSCGSRLSGMRRIKLDDVAALNNNLDVLQQ